MTIEDDIRLQAIKNAFLHDGKAEVKAVSAKIFGEHAKARIDPKRVISMVNTIVNEVNSMGREAIESEAVKHFPELLEKGTQKEEKRLPDLDNVGDRVVMRLAPSPSGPLHLGHSRMAILNDEYVKRYGGELILRLEDTNPANIDMNAYEMIPEDLKGLDVRVDKIVIQSDRFDLYYEEARKLIARGNAYVCFCRQEDFRALKIESKSCPHRNTEPQENMRRFEEILAGKYRAGEATVVIKTDLRHPNPSLRDWIAFRIGKAKHPRTGEKYYLYPMMNFSVAVDDHYLGLTHVLRGKDQLNNTSRQRFIFDYNQWEVPQYYHYGMISIPGERLKTSIIRKDISAGKYSGWDDIRLNTIRSLLKRGYQPETFRRYWIESGLREIDASFSWEIFNSMNRDVVDRNAKRLFFVKDPVKFKVQHSPEMDVKIPFHPEHKEMGFREFKMKADTEIFISSDDLNKLETNPSIRLKDLYNVSLKGKDLVYSDDQKFDPKTTRIIHWCPPNSDNFEVLRPDGNRDAGLIEKSHLLVQGISQFERYGYVTLSSKNDEGYFLHK
jgi:glutamyl-tRNA synthetase